MKRSILPLVVLACNLPAQSVHQGGLTGAVLVDGNKPFVAGWGDGVTLWQLDGGHRRLFGGQRFKAGCADADGTLYLLRGSQLVVTAPPYTNTRVLEADTEYQDCLPWTMDGRRGVLIPHRHLQLRFYSRTAPPVDLYSIYTPSKQGGLMERDVDGDGRMDLVWGNYWLERPREAGGHWRLFAINLFHEEEDSALARLAWGNGGLFWGAAAGRARLAFMRPPGDVRQIWAAEMLAEAPGGIRAMAAAGEALVVAHAGGVDAYERAGVGWTKRRLDGRAAGALYVHGDAVWGVFADGPGAVYRRR